MTDYKTFATQVRTMRELQTKRERSSAKLTAQNARTSEAIVDKTLSELFGDRTEVEQPKMDL